MYLRYVGPQEPAFDVDPTQEGRAPLRESGTCQAAAGVYGAPLDNRTLAGHMLGVVGIANGYVSLPWLDAAVELAPNDPELRNNRGAELARIDPDAALEEYRTARALDPCVPLYAMNEARMLFALGRRDEADRLVELTDHRLQARQITEGSVFVLLVRSAFAFERGQDAAAEDYLAQALVESDGAPVALETLAATRRLQGRHADAVGAMRAALRRDPSLRSRVGLLLAELDAGLLFEASAQLDRALHEVSTPGALDLHVALVGAALGRTDEAEAAARRCIARHGRRCARALVALGDVARWRGDEACARRYYSAYLSCPRAVDSRAQRAAERDVLERLQVPGAPTRDAARGTPTAAP
jgi:tetratricopeptide (TPR) repeat protein